MFLLSSVNQSRKPELVDGYPQRGVAPWCGMTPVSLPMSTNYCPCPTLPTSYKLHEYILILR